MSSESLKPYVEAALVLHGFRFDPATTDEITLQFSRIQAIAKTFVDQDLPVALESAAVFRP